MLSWAQPLLIPARKLGASMALAVVNYPTLSPADFDWIQSIRERHDPLYFDVVDPHVTLVFPTDAVAESALIEHVRSQTAGLRAFDLTFRCAVLGDPSFQDHAHAFFIPDEGFSQVVRLHDRLYTGLLSPELRLDLPFLPHLGFANAPSPEECKTIVDEVNAKEFEMRARIETLDVIGYDGKRVWTIETIGLTGD